MRSPPLTARPAMPNMPETRHRTRTVSPGPEATWRSPRAFAPMPRSSVQPPVQRRSTGRGEQPAAPTVQRRSTFVAETPVTRARTEMRKQSPFPLRVAAKRPTRTVSAKNLNDPELLGYNKPRTAATERASYGGPGNRGMPVEIYRPRRLQIASFQPQRRTSVGVVHREPVRRSQSYTSLSPPKLCESVTRERTESLHVPEVETNTPSRTSDGDVKRTQEQPNVVSDSAAIVEDTRSADSPGLQSIEGKDVLASEETKSTTPSVAEQDLPIHDAAEASLAPASVAVVAVATAALPATPRVVERAIPSVPAGALMTPRRTRSLVPPPDQRTPPGRSSLDPAARLGPGGLPHRPASHAPHGLAVAVPMPGHAVYPPGRVLAPAPVPLGVARPRDTAAVATDTAVAQNCTAVRSELQLLKGYAAQLESTVGDTQAQLVEAVSRNKELVQGDQIIAQSCAGVQEELHRIRSYAATLSTVVEDKQVVSELTRMSDFAKELENFLPQRPLQPGLAS